MALRWSDVDLDAGRLVISRAIVAGPNGLVVKDTETHAASTVSLDAPFQTALLAHRQRADERAPLCGIELSPDAHVFSTGVDGATPWYLDSSSRHVRPEPVADGSLLVVRDGPDTATKLAAHALRAHRAYVLDGEPVFGVSVFAALDDIGPASLDGLLAGRMATYRQVHLPTAGSLMAAGFTLLPTFGRPHVTVVLGSADDLAMRRVLDALGPPRANPYHGGPRRRGR